MKILQVSNYITPAHGGSAEVPFQLSRTLAGIGHSVSVYTSNLGLQDAIALPGVNINAFSSFLDFAGFSITPSMIKKARGETGGFDIIHLHNYRTFQNIVAHHYAKKYGVPYIVQAHGSLATYFQKNLLKRVFDTVWGRSILKDAVKVFAVTEFEAEQYRTMGISRDRIEIIPHGINLVDFDTRIEEGEFRKKYRMADTEKIILYLGRINKIKGLDLLAGAFAESVKSRKDIKLAIAGPDDGYLSFLKKRVDELKITEKVVFTGPLYGSDKLEAYHDADFCVLPSSYEIFGITILEAWACSKPVIVTDRCGLAHVVKDSAGLVVSYEQASLYNAITTLLENQSLGRVFGRQGRNLVEEKYNWVKVAAQVESIYSSVSAKR